MVALYQVYPLPQYNLAQLFHPLSMNWERFNQILKTVDISRENDIDVWNALNTCGDTDLSGAGCSSSASPVLMRVRLLSDKRWMPLLEQTPTILHEELLRLSNRLQNSGPDFFKNDKIESLEQPGKSVDNTFL